MQYLSRFWTSWRSFCLTWSLTSRGSRPASPGSHPWPRGYRCPRGRSSRGWWPRPPATRVRSPPRSSSPRGSRVASCPPPTGPTLPSSGLSILSPASPQQPPGPPVGELPRRPSPAQRRPLARSNMWQITSYSCVNIVNTFLISLYSIVIVGFW